MKSTTLDFDKMNPASIMKKDLYQNALSYSTINVMNLR